MLLQGWLACRVLGLPVVLQVPATQVAPASSAQNRSLPIVTLRLACPQGRHCRLHACVAARTHLLRQVSQPLQLLPVPTCVSLHARLDCMANNPMPRHLCQPACHAAPLPASFSEHPSPSMAAFPTAGAAPPRALSTRWARSLLAAPTTRSRRCRPAMRLSPLPSAWAPSCATVRAFQGDRSGEGSAGWQGRQVLGRMSSGSNCFTCMCCRPPANCCPAHTGCISCSHAGTKLFGVGFCASLLGVGITNGLMLARQMLDPSFVPLNPPQVRLLVC